MKYGLSEEQLQETIAFIRKYPEVERAVLFGSRAIGAFKEASDVDIALFGAQVTAGLAVKLKFDIEEDTYLPFFFDFIAYPSITNEALREHIDTKGVVLFGGKTGGDLREGWRECKLGDLISLEYGKALTGYQNSDGQYSVYGTNGIIGRTNNFLCQSASVIIGRKGAYRGIHYSSMPFYVIDTAFYVKALSNQIDMLFLYYFLLTIDIDAMDSGSAIPSTDRYEVYEIPILLPSLDEQKSIALILSSFNDKIDLLHRQNKTLENLAEMLFRQWFVEDADERWDEKTLDDIITVKGGTTPNTKVSEYWDGDIYWTSPRDLSTHKSVFLFDTERKITSKGLDQIGSGLLPVGSVLLSSRAPIGYLAITDIPLAINQGYIGIICDKAVSNWFIYLWCKENMELIKNSGNGSVFQEISKSTFKSLLIQVPNQKTLDKFDTIIEPYFNKVRYNQTQIILLEKMRDGLLPKLMSGEVKIDV